jgi:hypothetical protein
MLLYSKTLYSIYLNSGKLFIFFLILLTIYSLINTKYFKTEFKVFFYFLLGILCFEILPYFLNMYFTNTHFINYPYGIFTFILCVLFYHRALNYNKLIYVTSSFFIIYMFFILLQMFNINWFFESPNSLPILNTLIIILSLITHFKISKSLKIKNITNEPLFWINLGFLILNLYQLILKPIFNSIINVSSDDIGFIIGTLKNLADPITYTLWAIGVYKLKTQPFRPIASLWP